MYIKKTQFVQIFVPETVTLVLQRLLGKETAAEIAKALGSSCDARWQKCKNMNIQ